jgi:hypothetical protein
MAGKPKPWTPPLPKPSAPNQNPLKKVGQIPVKKP